MTTSEPMTDTFDAFIGLTRLQMPAQDLNKLSFCDSSKAAKVQAWVDQLQATRITHTGVQLYKNLPEISRLRTDPRTRLAMLEAMRPMVHSVITGLAQQFLGQPLILPDSAQKTAIVAQALQISLAQGYSICVRDLIQLKTLNAQNQENLAKALARAMFSISALHLRACQIYTHLPPGWWFHLHQLLRTAVHYRVEHTPVADPLLKHRSATSAQENYLRTTMLACSRTNQLSQQDLQFAFDAFESWAPLVQLSEEVNPNTGNPFVINLSRDEPPIYKERFNGDERDYLLEPDFSGVVRALDRERETGKTELATPSGMPAELRQHLSHTWQTTSDRQQHRHKVRAIVDVCVGITECHFHMAGETEFTRHMERGSGGAESRWSQDSDYTNFSSFTPADRRSSSAASGAYPPSRVSVQNISAGGYCLYWQEKVPAHATAGQLLGIRDAGKKEWHLGVVRWVRQLKGASQMGVQILALDAEPAAASLKYDMGGYSDAMRVFMVPGRSGGEAAPTLITAAAPFQESSRLRLVRGRQAHTVTLDRTTFVSSKVRQFRYQITGTEAEAGATESASASPPAAGQFDSEWD